MQNTRNARGAQRNVTNDPPRVVEEHEGVEDIAPPHRQPLAQMGRAQLPANMVFKEDDLDLDGVGATRAIVLHALPLGATGDDANHHLMNFVAIYKSEEIPGVSHTGMRLRLFTLSLTGEATNWLNELPDDSVRTWTELKEAFLERLYPESKELQMKDEIGTHKLLPGEAMHDTWSRFSQKRKKCLNHGLWVLRAPDPWAIAHENLRILGKF
ncbi:hypothetical protein KY289_005650 [Solanum tuberosum]|nr:hypothetical protein KY289_005650 [Solanum tuberosum]